MSNIHLPNNKNNNHRKFLPQSPDSPTAKRLSSPSFSDRKVKYNEFRYQNKQLRPASKNERMNPEVELPTHIPPCQSARYPAQLDFQSEYLRFANKSNPVSSRSISNRNSTVNEDAGLLQSMTSKLFEFQQEIQHLRKELEVKNSQLELKQKEIMTLKVKVVTRAAHLANKYKNKGEEFLKLCENCEKLEKTLDEVEKFLKEYDLKSVNEEIKIQDEMAHQPVSEILSPPEIDFDLLLGKFDELNILAGEGSSQIVYTNDGATFKLPEEIPLTLFLNGLMLFSGPFRDYNDRTTQLFLRDIFDGYFPSELQTTYPNGVPFKIIDKHTIYYDGNKKKLRLFSGPGYRLGRRESARPMNRPLNRKKDEYQDLNRNSLTEYFESQDKIKFNQNRKMRNEISTEENGESYSQVNPPKNFQMTKEQLLDRLPSCTIKEGRIIDIRNSVAEFITPTNDRPPVQILKHNSSKREDNIRLKIRSFRGEKIFIVDISARESVHALYKILDSALGEKSCKYKILETISRVELPDVDLPLKSFEVFTDCVLVLQKKGSSFN